MKLTLTLDTNYIPLIGEYLRAKYFIPTLNSNLIEVDVKSTPFTSLPLDTNISINTYYDKEDNIYIACGWSTTYSFISFLIDGIEIINENAHKTIWHISSKRTEIEAIKEIASRIKTNNYILHPPLIPLPEPEYYKTPITTEEWRCACMIEPKGWLLTKELTQVFDSLPKEVQVYSTVYTFTPSYSIFPYPVLKYNSTYFSCNPLVSPFESQFKVYTKTIERKPYEPRSNKGYPTIEGYSFYEFNSLDEILKLSNSN